jgi:hypothetical protein
VGGAISGERPWRRSRLVELSSDPAAGAAPSLAVPAGEVWEVVSVYAQLVTDATVANRLARLQLGDGTATYLDLAAPAVQAASLTHRYAWVQHGSAYAVGLAQVATIPRLVLAAGWTVAIATDNLAAGDNWTALRLLVVKTIVKGGAIDLADLPDLIVEVAGATPA